MIYEVSTDGIRSICKWYICRWYICDDLSVDDLSGDYLSVRRVVLFCWEGCRVSRRRPRTLMMVMIIGMMMRMMMMVIIRIMTDDDDVITWAHFPEIKHVDAGCAHRKAYRWKKTNNPTKKGRSWTGIQGNGTDELWYTIPYHLQQQQRKQEHTHLRYCIYARQKE